jgi:6-pyruvoyl-tetrahydropterin synthase
MYGLEVRDHIMIAHSFKGEFFGPAQRVHGATFVCDVAFFRETLGPNEVVVDIGAASDALKATLAAINYRNLDEVQEFKGRQTTTEFLARYVFDQMKAALKAGKLGADSDGISKIKVTMHESHVARGWYEAAV